MKWPYLLYSFLILLVVCSTTWFQSTAKPKGIDVRIIKDLPILMDGRLVPFDTYARKFSYTVYGKERGEGKDPNEFLLSVVRNPDPLSLKIIRIENHALMDRLQIPRTEKFTSYNHVAEQKELLKIQEEYQKKVDEKIALLPQDEAFGRLSEQLNYLAALIRGESLTFYPMNQDRFTNWTPVVHLKDSQEEDAAKMYDGFKQMLSGNFHQDNKDFTTGLGKIRSVVSSRFLSHHQNLSSVMKLELVYNKLKPFRVAWMLYLLGCIAAVLMLVLAKPQWKEIAFFTLIAGFVAHTFGLGLRVAILNRPPVGNMYESVVFVGWAIVVFYFFIRSRLFDEVVLFCTLLAATLTMIMADLLPMSSELGMLEAVLRSNYWLTIHVLTIVSSYGAFALACAIGHYYLYKVFKGVETRDPLMKAVAGSIYKAMKIGIILIGAGTILGGVWANESWGRFWGWDPKETWALISFLGYLALLHGRKAGWYLDFGLAVGSILGFLLILMTWYGVNFVLGIGLHSYGFGSGGTHYALLFTLFEVLLLAYVAFYRKRFISPSPAHNSEA